MCTDDVPGCGEGLVEASFLRDTRRRRRRVPPAGAVWTIPWRTATKAPREARPVAFWDVAAAQEVSGVRVSPNGLCLSPTA